MRRIATGVMLLLGVGIVPLAIGATPEWVATSNRWADRLLAVQARYTPEQVSGVGLETYDRDITDLKPGVVAREEADLASVTQELVAARDREGDPRVREDLAILIKSAQDQRTTLELNDRLMLPYFDLPQALYRGFQQLLDKRTAKNRHPAALERLKRYIGTERGYEPIAKLARARVEERFGDPQLTAPWSVEVQEELRNQTQYLSGIHDLLKDSGLKGWEKDFAVLSTQIEAYGRWVQEAVLPRARANNLLPPAIYADNLKGFGVSMDPQELIDRALLSFAQTRDEMQSLALGIARQHGWKSTDYRDVLKELKKERIPNERLLAVYRERLTAIEDIARKEHLVSIPNRQASIRLATAAESTAIPAPHMNPPRLIGNTGEAGEFVLPISNPNAESKADLDDHNFDAITWDLTAHEARPGHELQFAAMVEGGVSTARAVFAYNSANVEGWALYAEAMMRPYFDPEAQLGVLQARLLRSARAFLDPMLNLGMMTPAEAKRVLVEDVVLSEPNAKQEVDRYTFTMPGQATSYLYGYSKLESLRAKTEVTLGAKFSALSYHDFILAQGLLPPDLLEQAVLERYIRPRQGAEVPH